MNVNLRMQSSSYINLALWQGTTNLNVGPDTLITVSSPAGFTNISANFYQTTGSVTFNLAEIRIFQLDAANSWGQYFKYYSGIWPPNTGFSAQAQYYTAFGNVFYMDISNSSINITGLTLQNIPIERCPYGYYITSKNAADASNSSIVQLSTQQCVPCPMKDCQICPTQNFQFNATSCKVCSNVRGTKCAVDTQLCPFNFFSQNGLCVRCPPGCLGCSSARQCFNCTDQLVMLTNLTHNICRCPNGQYGIPNFYTGALTCQNCNTSACQFCDGSANSCTQCFSALGLFLYGSSCVSNCSNQIIPSFPASDSKCYPCGQYCQNCTNNVTCLPQRCQFDGNPNGVNSYNHNGICKINCPDNTLLNIGSKSCDNCGPNCAGCSTVTTNCTVCNTGYYLHQSTCIDQCPTGMYPDGSNICQPCDSNCTTCLSLAQCTTCITSQRRYFVNFQCVRQCPDKYYPDDSDDQKLFCRSCPSGCNQCLNENQCTVCDNGNWYLDYFYGNTRQLCVNECQQGRYPDNSTMTCKTCLTGCERCDNVTTCYQCQKGLVLQKTGSVTTCQAACSAGMYADYTNTCKNCITGCNVCLNNHTCQQCQTGYFLVDGTFNCVQTTCPVGYFASGSMCIKCRPQCSTCSSATTCDSCIIGFSYGAGQCSTKCGNGAREDNEQCDDNNPDSGDGCSSTCQLEPGFICMPLDPTTTGPDVCFCDPNIISAVWTDFWSQIQLNFGDNLVYNQNNGPKSQNAKIFCSQILSSSLLPLLGTDYGCFLDSSPTLSTIRITVDVNSLFGSSTQNFSTQIVLNNNAIQVLGCPNSIPLTYKVTNLPLDSPIVYFQSSHSSLIVPKCAPYYGLNIFTSKGFTTRDISVTWTLLSIFPDDSDLKSALQSYLDTNYQNVKYFEFTSEQIESLGGHTLTVKVSVTNFLGIVGTNITTITFSNMKTMLLVDLQDIYTFQTAVDNKLAPRIRIPYCQNGFANNQANELKFATLLCTLYSQDLLTKTSLTNCTIPAFNMTLGKSYQVKIQAVNSRDPNLSVTKWVHIDTASPNSVVANIAGCNRLFNVDNDFTLQAMISTNQSYANFNWYCTDGSSGSPCFTTSFSYITMANTQSVTISGGQLFPNNTYIFTVMVQDSLSQTTATKVCYMYAAPKGRAVFDIDIDTEANKNGFIDFNAQMAAFKAVPIGTSKLNNNLLQFNWTFTDSSGTMFKKSDLSIYQNSLGVLISKLVRSNIYKVEVNATYGNASGYIKTFYQTEPSMSFDFSVEPPVGEPHQTIFTFSVTSQDAFDGLYNYVFGYINPVDGISYIPIYQKSANRAQRTLLPYPSNQPFLTCYAQVMLPSGESKTYLQNVTLTYPTITVAMFQTYMSNSVMDNLIESMQVKDMLVTLQSQMVVADKAKAILLILQGLLNEKTPLSDYYIQSSVASLLEFVSKQTDSLMTNSQLLTQAAQLFQQMTIGENININNGQYSQFGRAATFSLYNFANNVFQKDYSSVIGGQQQLQMKVMFMQGLKNILKGSLKNQILGDQGGFSYQGQNIYVKAVKFDQLESSYFINASLPVSLTGKLSQSFVNISLPNSQSPSNPCLGYQACQGSIIILDQPTSAYISSSKDAQLMSIYVDLSLQQTEVSSLSNYISISDIKVTGLVDPISMTIPLLTPFTDTSGNKTLGCGYLDDADQIFKADGIGIKVINNRLVTCLASHLTAIGVESYTVDRQNIALTSSAATVADNSTTSSVLGLNNQLSQPDLWGSWAVYATIILLGVMILGWIWGYQRDKRDELNLKKVFMNKDKIYINLFLDPLPEDAQEGEDEDDYYAIQEEKDRLAQIRLQKLNARQQKYARAALDERIPVKGLFTPDELKTRFGIIDPEEERRMKEEEAKNAKKKKKKKKTVDQSDMFFEGGDRLPYPEYDPQYDEDQFEGGDDEEEKKGDEDLEDEGAISVKQKGKGKKKKKKSKTIKNKLTINTIPDDIPKEQQNEAASPNIVQEEQLPMSPQKLMDDALVLEEIDGKSIKSKKSTKKKKKKSAKKSITVQEQANLPPEEEVKFNDVVIAGFQQQADSPPPIVEVDPQVDIKQHNEGIPEMDETMRSRKSKKGSKSSKNKRGRSSSRARRLQLEEEDTKQGIEVDEHLKADIEAEEYSPNKKRGDVTPRINKDDLFKPISQIEKQNDEEDLMLNQDLNYNGQNQPIENQSQSPSTQKKKKLKKKKTSKKKKKKQQDEDSESDSSSDDDHGDGNQDPANNKKERDDDEEVAGGCMFCFWNFREGHRCLSFFSYYNYQMTRPVRWVLLCMSWYLFITFSGLFIGGNDIIGDKSTRIEQFMCGFMATLFMRPFILLLTFFLMHFKEDKVLEMIENRIKANRQIRANKLRFNFGVGFLTLIIIACASANFRLSANYSAALVENWKWAFIFSMVSDFVIIEGFYMAVVTLITVNVGVAPDACGTNRAFWLKLIPPAIKDSVE